MWINRDLSPILKGKNLLEIVAVLGPRQVGKSSLLTHGFPACQFLSLDDLHLRQRARTDPALFLALAQSPSVIVDEFQYAPELLPEMKLRVDAKRRERMSGRGSAVTPRFFLSGSNQLLVDQALRETLAGRVSLFLLHGLSIHELLQDDPHRSISTVLIRGGFPELYARPELSPVDYINDYIGTFVEKDIARSAGVQKIEEFLLVTKLLAARAGELVNDDGIAQDSGVAPKTVGEWRSILDRARITTTLPVYSSNLNTRLIKTPKTFFIDSGLLVRLQGHREESAILSTPQAGHLFENLVVAEAVKTRDHLKLPWSLSYWRTKDREELDLIVESGSRRIFIEAKLAVQNVKPIKFPPSLTKVFKGELNGCVVTPTGASEQIGGSTTRVPIAEFSRYLRENL